MSNHFPTPPSSGAWDIVSVIYTAVMPFSGDLSDGGWPIGNSGDLDFSGVNNLADNDTSMFIQPNGGGSQLFSYHFQFTTAGTTGSFDQDTAETAIASVLDSIAQALATATGYSLATTKGWIVVNRVWAFQTGDYEMSFTDTMTYP